MELSSLSFQTFVIDWFYCATCDSLGCPARFKWKDGPCHIIETPCCALMRRKWKHFFLWKVVYTSHRVSQSRNSIAYYREVIKGIWKNMGRNTELLGEEIKMNFLYIFEAHHWEQKYIHKTTGKVKNAWKKTLTAFQRVLCMFWLCVSCCWVSQDVHSWNSEPLIKMHSSRSTDEMSGICM